MTFGLRKAIDLVDWYHAQGRYLNHTLLHRMMDGLTPAESNYLTDYIVSKYNVISAVGLKKYFDTYEQLLTSLHSTTGSEYDLKEELDRSSDSVYREMILEMRKIFGPDVRGLIVCSSDKKFELADHLRHKTAATLHQIFKFLHLEVERK